MSDSSHSGCAVSSSADVLGQCFFNCKSGRAEQIVSDGRSEREQRLNIQDQNSFSNRFMCLYFNEGQMSIMLQGDAVQLKSNILNTHVIYLICCPCEIAV